MLDKLSSFRSHTMTEIRILVGAHYAFCKRLNILDYTVELLEKNKFFCDDIENVNNSRHCKSFYAYRLTNYIQVQRRFSALIIIDAIIIIFYKATQNSGLFFNVAISDFFNPFYLGILAFLITIVHCGINKYQSDEKVMIPFNGKTV